MLSPQERWAIQALYDELSADYWQRRHALEARQRSAALSETERDELLDLIEQGEAWNVKRLAFLFELAQRHGVPHDHFLDSLGIRHHPLCVKV